MIFAPWKVKAIGALALVAILAGTSAGWWFTKTAYERDISDLKGEQAREREGWLKEKLAITARHLRRSYAEAIHALSLVLWEKQAGPGSTVPAPLR